jgi:hypothetical protein
VVYISAIFQEVEETGQVKGLSFADDVAWWAEGRNDQEVAERLSRASEVACSWAGSNGYPVITGRRCWNIAMKIVN